MSAKLRTPITLPPCDEEIYPYTLDRFPPGRRIYSTSFINKETRNFSSYGYQKSEFDKQNDMMNYYGKDKERPQDLTFPRLVFDRSLTYKKRTNCSFINNHKTYLKMKGFDVNHVYSLKRTHRHNASNDVGMRNSTDIKAEISKLSRSDLDLPELFNNDSPVLRRASTQRNSERIWRPNDSRKPSYVNKSYSRLLQGFDQGPSTSSHVRVGYLTSKPLGNVMTKTHLRSLLAQEETVIPNTLYKKFNDGV